MFRALFVFTLMLSTLVFGGTKSSTPLIGDRVPTSATLGMRHEVITNLSDYSLNNFSTATVSFGNGTRISFGGAYFQQMLPNIQLGGKLGVQHSSNNFTLFEVMAASRFNIPFRGTGFDDSFFAGLGIGFGMIDQVLSRTTLLVDFEFGKRFLLFPHLTWQPSIEVKIPTSGLYDDVMVAFRFLTLSVIF